jgi:hypothetical protein
MSEIIWSGQMGPAGRRHEVEVVRLADSVFRGVMHIFGSEGEMLYQKEVAITHGSPFGADAQVAAGWMRVFEDWLDNRS